MELPEGRDANGPDGRDAHSNWSLSIDDSERARPEAFDRDTSVDGGRNVAASAMAWSR